MKISTLFVTVALQLITGSFAAPGQIQCHNCTSTDPTTGHLCLDSQKVATCYGVKCFTTKVGSVDSGLIITRGCTNDRNYCFKDNIPTEICVSCSLFELCNDILFKLSQSGVPVGYTSKKSSRRTPTSSSSTAIRTTTNTSSTSSAPATSTDRSPSAAENTTDKKERSGSLGLEAGAIATMVACALAAIAR